MTRNQLKQMKNTKTRLKPIRQCKTLQELFASKSRWIRGHWAVTNRGVLVYSNNPEACAFCFDGGITKIYGKDFNRCSEVYWKVAQELQTSCIIDWNDEKATYEDVVALCKKLNI